MKKVVDCRGLACPKPVIITKKQLESEGVSEVVSIVDNETARQNVHKLADSLGYKTEIEEKEGFIYITIRKEEVRQAAESDVRNFVIMIGSDKLGVGDEKLGSALMKSYVYALSESTPVPESIFFVNSGVRLTTEGSDVIDSLKTLEQKGVEIFSCGTCLDFYNLKEKLIIGSVTNMYNIVEKMNNASNTIKL